MPFLTLCSNNTDFIYKEIVDYLNDCYEDCVTPEPAMLEVKLAELKNAIDERMNVRYDHRAAVLLNIAANNYDEETFRIILGTMDRKTLFITEGHALNCNSMFVTTDKKFVDIILDSRHGKSVVSGKESIETLINYCGIDMTAFELSVLSGNVEMLEYLLEKGILKQEDYSDNAFAFALLSKNLEMIKYIKNNHEVVWDDDLRNEIAFTDEALSQALLEIFPDLVLNLTPYCILQGTNSLFLKTYFKRVALPNRESRFIEAYERLETERKTGLCLKPERNVRTEEELVAFYTYFWNNVKDEKLKGLIQKDVYVQMVRYNYIDDMYKMGTLNNFFHMTLSQVNLQDYTNIIAASYYRVSAEVKFDRNMVWAAHNLRLIAEGGEKIIGTLNPYKAYGVKKHWIINKKISDAMLQRLVHQTKLIMRHLKPEPVENKLDLLTCIMVASGKWENVMYAIRKNYITKVNAGVLYEYGLKNSPDSREMLEELSKLSIKNDNAGTVCIDIEATGKNLKKRMDEMGVTARSLANICGFENPQAVYKWLTGKSLPSIDNMLLIAHVLDVNIQEIISYDVAV